MAVDTGAGVSIISSETGEKCFFSIPLTPCSTQLYIYTSSTIEVRGQFHADVLYEDQQAALPLIVVQETGPPLLGMNWLHTIRLNNVFKPGLGTMRRITVKLELKEDARPSFF